MALNIRHPAGKSRSLASIVVVLSITLFLTACGTTGFGGFSGSGERRAERFARDGQHHDAAGVYIGLATNAIGIERDRLTLLAVEQWLDAGDLPRAQRAFASVVRPTSGPLLPIFKMEMSGH